MKGKHPIAPQMATPDMIRRPLRDLIAALAQLPTTPSGEPDYDEAEPDVLVFLAESAELAVQIMHQGLSAIGLLYAHTADQIAAGQIKAVHAAALGTPSGRTRGTASLHLSVVVGVPTIYSRLRGE